MISLFLASIHRIASIMAHLLPTAFFSNYTKKQINVNFLFINFRSSLFNMNFFNVNDDINHSSNIPLTNIQTTRTTAAATTTTTSSSSSSSVVVNQESKDLSDWRNIQLGGTSTIFDPYYMPTTMHSWTTPNTPIYPSPYDLQSTSAYPWIHPNNQSWPITTFGTNTGLSFMNCDASQQNFFHSDTNNDIIDLTTNNTVNTMTPVRFVQTKFMY